MKEKIGFIGVGTMGKPMALNILKAGYPLVVHDLNPKPVQELKEQGAATASSAKEVASQSDIVITMLPKSEHVQAAVLGKDGVIEGAKKGTLVIDMSTIDPSVSRKTAEALAAKGIDMLDGPVSGGETGARAGTLTIMVGGRKRLTTGAWTSSTRWARRSFIAEASATGRSSRSSITASARSSAYRPPRALPWRQGGGRFQGPLRRHQ